MSDIVSYDPKSQIMSVEEKQKRVTRRIKVECTNAFQTLKDFHQGVMQLVWNNPANLTPQQVFDAFGKDAKDLFVLSNVVITAINSVKPDSYNIAVPYDYTINPDGTVTVGDPK